MNSVVCGDHNIVALDLAVVDLVLVYHEFHEAEAGVVVAGFGLFQQGFLDLRHRHLLAHEPSLPTRDGKLLGELLGEAIAFDLVRDVLGFGDVHEEELVLCHRGELGIVTRQPVVVLLPVILELFPGPGLAFKNDIASFDVDAGGLVRNEGILRRFGDRLVLLE